MCILRRNIYSYITCSHIWHGNISKYVYNYSDMNTDVLSKKPPNLYELHIHLEVFSLKHQNGRQLCMQNTKISKGFP